MVLNAQTGDVVQRIDYDEFGNITYLQNQNEFINITFAGGLHDADTGLIRFGARDYDPAVGRWTTKDPILFDGGTSNLYEYGLNDPVNNIDPDGLQSLTDVRDFVGAAIGNFTTIPFTDYSISDEVLSLFGQYGYYNPCSDAAQAGELAGTIGQLAAGGKALLAGGKALFNLVRAAEKTPKLLAQFNSVESLIENAGKLTRLKGGVREGFVKGNIDDVFSQLSRQYGAKIQTRSGETFFKSGSVRVGKHISRERGQLYILIEVENFIKLESDNEKF